MPLPINTVNGLAMYIRFVTTQIDRWSHQPQGLFTASGALLSSFDTSTDDYDSLQDELAWFDDHLPCPDDPRIRDRAIFWYRANALDYIRRMWRLAFRLQASNRLIELQKCRFLFNVVYRDEFQVAAIPHRRDAERTYK